MEGGGTPVYDRSNPIDPGKNDANNSIRMNMLPRPWVGLWHQSPTHPVHEEETEMYLIPAFNVPSKFGDCAASINIDSVEPCEDSYTMNNFKQ